MPRIRRISEKIVWLYNPCPVVTEAELLSEAKLDNIEPSNLPPFEVRWKYGGTGESEWLVLRPGDLHGVRESESAEFLREFQEQGMTVLNGTDPGEAAEKAIPALRIAMKFWKDRGAKRAMEYRKKNALSADDMEEYRYDLWAYYLNEAKAKRVEAEMKRIQNGGRPVGFESDDLEIEHRVKTATKKR